MYISNFRCCLQALLCSQISLAYEESHDPFSNLHSRIVLIKEQCSNGSFCIKTIAFISVVIWI